jgi:tRNA (adenine57-N1/adenine58-N1)-methyltransferase
VAVLLVREDREYLLDPGETLETDLGVLEVPEDVEPGETLETHLGTEFVVRGLRGPALFRHLERTGAPMMPRDVGLLVGHTGIESGDRVLDAGTGTGILAVVLGRLGARVHTYEIDEEFAGVARENVATAGVEEQVTVHDGDITENLGQATRDLEEGRFDALTLDTADAPAVVERAETVLAPGGALAVYSPFVEDAREVATTAATAGFEEVTTLETIQRELSFDERGTRPSTAGVGHTGYLTVGQFGFRPDDS